MHANLTIMNFRTASLPFLFATLLLSCSQQPDVTTNTIASGVERTVKEVSIGTGEPVTFADISIDGMSCEMMCGGSIKKALAKLPGIAATEIKFVEGDERDHAIVTYDESKVSDAQMIEAIQGLHDGQYKVLAVEITKQVKGNSTSATGDKNAEDEGVSVIAPAVSLLPSILALLTQIGRL
jgi:copper chaperone CopZ